MHRQIITKTFLLLLGIFTISACSLSPDYNVNFPEPSSDVPKDVFPFKIGDDEGTASHPKFGGILIEYGTNKTIFGAALPNHEDAVAFFKNNLLQDIKAYQNNFSGTVNGQFYAKGSIRSEEMFGWVNGRFAFYVKATTEADMKEIIENFDYIAFK